MQTEDDTIKVLMVDDDEDDYVLTRDLLSEAVGARFKLDWENSYDSALQDMADSHHHIYLVDYLLGEHDGLKLMRTALKKGCRSPVIMFTGQGDHKVDLEAMKAGAADYLEKGELTVPLLERTIRYALERKKLESLKHDVD
ncbi:MAG: response regulator, partial [Desulfovibrionales bacterium]|nr:response regulator [Desulfovibrionales bacterium]